MFRFANPEYFYLLLAILVLLAIFLWKLRWRKKAMESFGDPEVVGRLIPDYSIQKTKTKIFIQLSAFALMVIAIAGPQFGSKLEEIKREGVDIMIALDVSNSMLAEDLSPNRLERAKRAMLQLVDNLKGDRLGIVIFAGEAYVQLPITTDYGAAKMFINTISTDVIATQGTAIGNAISLSMKSFGEKNEKQPSRVIIVVSDGEDHQDNPVEIAGQAAKEGFVIHTVGVGSPQGAPIPQYLNGRPSGFKTDREGNTVMTRLDEATMQQIAATAGGIYVRATNAEAGLNVIMDEINEMQKQEYSSKMFTDYDDKFQYLIAFALLLLIIDFFLPEKKSKNWRKLNLFGAKGK
jgi:Ca-activated chloride channel homolog